jgi:hypothetical protein
MNAYSLLKHHTMKMYWGAAVQLHTFLTSTLDGGELSASCPRHFTIEERALLVGTHWRGGIGCCVGSRAKLGTIFRKCIFMSLHYSLFTPN